MDASQSQGHIPPRLYGDIRTAASRLLERLESEQSAADAIKNTQALVLELNGVAQQCAPVVDRFRPREIKDTSSIEPDSAVGRVLGLQASAQSFAVALMVFAQLQTDGNALALAQSTKLLLLQSCRRIIENENTGASAITNG
jgi:hypothetical protein